MSDLLTKILLDPEIKGRNKLVLGILSVFAKNNVITFQPSWLQGLTSLGQSTLKNRLEWMEKIGYLKPRTAPLPRNGEEPKVTYEIIWRPGQGADDV